MLRRSRFGLTELVVEHAAFTSGLGAGAARGPHGRERSGLLAPAEADDVGVVEGDVPELAVVLHQGAARLLRVLAQVLRHEPHAPDAPRPLRVRLVALDAGDALARDLVEHHHARLVLQDLPLLRVLAVVADVQRLVEAPPEAVGVLEPRQKVLRAVVRVVLAQDEYVRVQLEDEVDELVARRQRSVGAGRHLQEAVQPELAHYCEDLV